MTFPDATKTYTAIKLALRCHYKTQALEAAGKGCVHLTGFMPCTSSAVQ